MQALIGCVVILRSILIGMPIGLSHNLIQPVSKLGMRCSCVVKHPLIIGK